MTNYSRLIEILQRLIAYPTVTGHTQAVRDCLMYAERTFTISGMHINRYNCNGFESIVATTRNTMHPKVMLQAHLDVVPGDEPLFTMRREDGNLLGRGTFDMKYAAACFLKLVEDMHDDIQDYDFGVMFTTDEEYSGQDGVRYLLEQGYGCDVCVLPDGGDNWRLESAAKGNWMVNVTAKGKTAHGSRPWEGDNAADRLIEFLGALREISVVKAHTDTTLVVSTINAGKATNQIPEIAEATIDIRFLSPEAYGQIRLRLEPIARKYGVELNTVHLIPATQLDLSLPVVEDWERIVNEIRGQSNGGYALSFGSSDARYFAEKGIPTIVTRPDGGGHHSESEWIDESGLYEFYECLKLYVVSQAYAPLDHDPGNRYNDAKLPETVAADNPKG